MFNKLLELNLDSVEPSVAGPRRPQDRVPLGNLKRSFWQAMRTTFNREIRPDDVAGQGMIRWVGESGHSSDPEEVPTLNRTRTDLYQGEGVPVRMDGHEVRLTHGSAVIAAITSCTNTSNPSVMIAAGLLAKKAVERGLDVQPWVKTSLAPGSRVVTEYLRTPDCCRIWSSCASTWSATAAPPASATAARSTRRSPRRSRTTIWSSSAVLSGNRNFEGRINPVVRANYLASPPLVVAFAIAGTVDIDLDSEPLGHGADGQPVYLADIWPGEEEIAQVLSSSLSADMFKQQYGNVYTGNEQWNAIPVSGGDLYEWDANSTYIQNPPYFVGMTRELPPLQAIEGAYVLALLGDSVTTDHISPAGSIPKDSPAGRYLIEQGVEPRDFNSYGARRGNHEVMLRGTFANIRLRNQLAPGTEGGVTIHIPSGEQTSIYEAAMRYAEQNTPLIVLAGKEYGTGSSRDWAAKGTFLLGVRAVIAESFERIHRSNLLGMGVLPLEFNDGDTWQDLGLDGHERYTIEGLETLKPGERLTVRAVAEDGSETTFPARARIDSQGELEYYRNGGILQYVLRQLAAA